MKIKSFGIILSLLVSPNLVCAAVSSVSIYEISYASNGAFREYRTTNEAVNLTEPRNYFRRELIADGSSFGDLVGQSSSPVSTTSLGIDVDFIGSNNQIYLNSSNSDTQYSSGLIRITDITFTDPREVISGIELGVSNFVQDEDNGDAYVGPTILQAGYDSNTLKSFITIQYGTGYVDNGSFNTNYNLASGAPAFDLFTYTTTIIPVPEPTTSSLLIGASLFFLGRRRRL